MKIYFYQEDGAVIDTAETVEPVNLSKVIAADGLPEYTPKKGFYGRLFVENGKLVWHYLPSEPDQQIGDRDLISLFEETL